MGRTQKIVNKWLWISDLGYPQKARAFPQIINQT